MKQKFAFLLIPALLVLFATGTRAVSASCEMPASETSGCCSMPKTSDCCEVPVLEICDCPINAVPVPSVFVPAPVFDSLVPSNDFFIEILPSHPKNVAFSAFSLAPPVGSSPLFITNCRLLI